jgi:hypothetical protein
MREIDIDELLQEMSIAPEEINIDSLFIDAIRELCPNFDKALKTVYYKVSRLYDVRYIDFSNGLFTFSKEEVKENDIYAYVNDTYVIEYDPKSKQYLLCELKEVK